MVYIVRYRLYTRNLPWDNRTKTVLNCTMCSHLYCLTLFLFIFIFFIRDKNTLYNEDQ